MNKNEPVQNFWEWLTDEQAQQKDLKERQPSNTPHRKTSSRIKGKSPRKKSDRTTPSRSTSRQIRTSKSQGRERRRKRSGKNRINPSKSEGRLTRQTSGRRKPGQKKVNHTRQNSSRSGITKRSSQKILNDPERSRSDSFRRTKSHSKGPSKSRTRGRKSNSRPGTHADRDTAKSEETMAFLKEVLSREIVFQRFGADVINEVMHVMYKLFVKAGDIMIRQGEVGDTYHVVEEGHFHIRVREPGGMVKTVAEALRGNAIGDASLFYNTPRRATLEAADDSLVWALDASDFRQIRQRWSQRENAKLEKHRNVLKRVPLFKNLTTEELTDIAKSFKEEPYPKGETIVSQGDVADSFFVLRKGTATVMKAPTRQPGSELGTPTVVNKYEPGDFFGERGLLLGQRRAATVVATTECRCFVWDNPSFSKYISKDQCEQIFYQTIESYKEIENPDQKPWKNRISTLLDEFENLGVLGVGSFGRVSLVKCPFRHKTYSLKSVRKNRVVETGQQEHMKNERLVMTLLDNDFTVRLAATYQDKTRVYFLMEAVLGGELFTVLRFNRKFSERTAKFYAGCCVVAFEHMHSHNILYRDLKPENLLLTGKGYIKLTDFGFAKRRNNTSTLCGTPEYLAPEVIRNWTQGFAVDWWTLGILIYEMIVSNPPFDDDDEGKKMYEKILTSPVKYPKTVSRSARDLIDKLLKKNAYQRLGAAPNGGTMIKRHLWWKNFDWDLLERHEMETPYVPRIRDREDLSNYESYPDEEIDDPLCANPDSDVFAWAREF